MNRTPLAVITLGVLLAAPNSLAAQESPFILDGLVVTASPTARPRDAVARAVTVLDGQALRARGVFRVVDALREVPGLDVVQGGSFGAATSVFMRGGESDYVQVLVDGVKVNQPGGSFDFAGLTLDDVERIEVVRGPASSLFGSDAMAGVIQIVTRTGDGAPRGVVSLQAGSYGRLHASASVSGGSATAGWAFSLSRLRTDGVLAFNNAHDNTVLTGSARLAPDDRTEARIAVRLADRTYHFPTDGSGAVTDHNAFTYGDEASVSVMATRKVSSRWALRGSVGLAQNDGGTDDQPDGPADTLGSYAFTSMDHVQRATVDVRSDVHLAGAVLTLGLAAEQEKQRSFSQSWSEWGTTPGQSRNRRWNRAGYAHATGAAGALTWAVGGRLEDNQRFGRAGTWNLGLTWRPLGNTRIRASAGTGVKEPTFYENFAEGWVRGNPDLRPERARSWDAGLDQALLGGTLLLRGTWFDQSFRDLIQYTATPQRPDDPNYFNVARSRVRGVELGAALRTGSVHADAAWTWLDTRVVDGGLDGGPGGEFAAGQPLLRRPHNTLHATVGVDGARGGVWGTVRVVGARQDRDFSVYPAERVTLARYTDVDVGAEIPVRRGGSGAAGLTFTVRAENLLDAAYQEVLGFPAPGRAVYLGGTVTLGGR